MPDTKQCSMCGDTKSTVDFYRSYKSRKGYSARCKKCQSNVTRESRLRSTYGITPEFRKAKYEAQRGKCDCCGKKLLFRSGKKQEIPDFYKGWLDHNHTTGQVRGILCNPCNLRLGHFENPNQMYLDYLKRYEGEPSE